MIFGTCKIYSFLAYAMAAYCIASLYYYVRTQSFGTPFKNSLTSAQLAIKRSAANARGTVFFEGIVVGALLLFFVKPFKDC